MEIQVVRLRRRFRVKGQRKQKKYCMFRTTYGKPYEWEDIPIEEKQFDKFIQITRQILTRAAEIEAKETNND